jgi:cell division protein FtsN
MNSKKNICFTSKEIIALFAVLLIFAVLIFSTGILIGKKILEKDCQLIIENQEEKLKKCLKEKEENNKNKEEVKKEKTPDINDNEEEIKPNYSNLAIKENTKKIKGKYTVQIASYQSEYKAQRIAYELFQKGYKSSYYTKADLKEKGIWYRVGIGFFDNYNSAKIFSNILKKQGIIESSMIRKIK